MNRQQRRKKEREYKKDIDFLGKLTPTQLKKIDEITNKVTSIKIDQFSSLINRCMSAVLIEEDWSLSEIDRVQNTMNELLLEDTQKSEKLEKENPDMQKIESDVREKIEELLDKGVTKTQSISVLQYKFPKLSKSMLLNAYQKIKEEKGLVKSPTGKQDVIDFFNKHANQLNGEQMIDNAMKEYGFTESTAKTYYYKWKKEFMVPTCKGGVCEIPLDDPSQEKIPVVKAKEPQEELKENAEKIIEAFKEAQGPIETKQESPAEKIEEVYTPGLKILEEKIIKSIKVEGNNGNYEGKTGEGIILTKDNAQISFTNAEELEEWIKEFKQVFAMLY